ncbi:MAG TPA: polyphosphate kinase 2 family protein [Acidobacteriaceae bacterium]|jgi:PPK2 family polyphosphate:nucleotide phosphotransferase
MKIKSPYLVKPSAKFRLKDYSTGDTGAFKAESDAQDDLEKHCQRLGDLQEVLFAEAKHALLIVLQAMDTGGKDGTIRHIFTGVNPQGVNVMPFKVPTPLEAAHDYLWRAHAAVPRLGTIGIFNRSHYEDVLVTRVHKTISAKQAKQRFREINQFEEMLSANGVTVLKFFLHISHKEQTARLKARCDDKEKHYKISESDFHERIYWDKYQDCYEDAIGATSRKHAPWFIIPADHKWYRNVAVSRIVVDALEGMKLKYPQPAFDVSKVCGKV